MTASGCGVTVKEYGDLLAHDPAYRDKAARIAALARDLSEVIPPEAVPERSGLARIAFHSPCSLQHGQQLRGHAERLLARAGFELAPVPDAHLCCGSAGTYSILQPDLAEALRSRKLAALRSGQPVGIVTANIGCLVHLQAGAGLPVAHWVELLDEALQG
jgi:glycolate oxidase iron-sulfur subunit